MELQEFIKEHNIDLRALEQVKKRVFIVGRFNNKPIKNDEPEIFLFTDRPQQDLSEVYKKNFTSVQGLSYESFIQALQPVLAERITPADKYNPMTMVEQVVPQGDEKTEEGTSVIDIFNYFFQRAVANTNQEAFEKSQPSLPKEMVQDDKKRGKVILTQIRKNLETFCNFQPHTHEIIDSLAQLLSQVAAYHGLPPFAHGGALPGGLPERLVDFVYALDDRTEFSVEGLSFSGSWSKLVDDEKSRQVFCDVVSAFRDALLTDREQYNGIRFRGTPLSRLAQTVVSDDLRSRSQKAREAFNGLRQILRSKVLLSMILEWLLNEYYTIPDMEGITLEKQRDDVVENAIINDWEKNGLAKPVKRPNPDERVEFSRLLTHRFSDVLKALTASSDSLPDCLNCLPDVLKDLVETVRRDENKQELFNKLADSKLEKDVREAFVDACNTILLDVLCPVLYRDPKLTTQQLKKYFQQETMAAYLTAVFLSDSDQDAVRKIAENHLEFFESKIDDASKTIKDEDKDKIIGRLLGDFLDVLATPEIQRRLGEGIRVVREVNALLDSTSLGADRRGGGDISVIRHEGDEQGTLAETPVDREMIKIAVRERAEHTLNETLSQLAKQKTADDTDNTPSKQDTIENQEYTQSDEDNSKTEVDPKVESILNKADGNQAESVPVELQSENEIPDTRLDGRINTILKKAIADTPKEYQGVNDTQKDALINNIVDQVLSDEVFVGGLADDIAAFEKTLHLIYTRYVENPDKRTFRNKVERMTLVNMMLLFQKELGLGKVSSNLHQLLLDLVLHLDPDAPDAKEFMREKSLTLYFDDAKLHGGITALRQTLQVQAQKSLDNTVSFVSELRGVWHLMRSIKSDRDAEIVVVNATADEFLRWLNQENLGGERDHYRLRSGHLTVNPESSVKPSDSIIQPGLVYLTDIAFTDSDKSTWLQNLAGMSLYEGEFSYLVPPICISTGAIDEGKLWADEGENWAISAENGPAPIFVIGPSPRLNPTHDGFPTTLPAGYLAAAHFLAHPVQKVQIENVGQECKGRFLVIGLGAAPMKDSLERALLGGAEKNDYAFEVDFYLYILLLIYSTARRQGGVHSGSIDAKRFFEYFFYEENLLENKPFMSAKIINKALIGNDSNIQGFGLNQNPAIAGLETVSFAPCRESLLIPGINKRTISNIQWFNRALKATGLKLD